MTYEVGQVVEYLRDGELGVVTQVGPLSDGLEHLGEYVVVLWGADQDGWLTGGWFLTDPPPLRTSDKPLPEELAQLINES